jgi:hypothetical protein
MNYKSIFSLTPANVVLFTWKEISVEGLTIADTHQLKEKVYSTMENKLREYKVAWLAPSTKGRSEALYCLLILITDVKRRFQFSG